MHSRLFISALLASLALAQKVDVDVYFESLCPDSKAFIVQQLYPTWLSPLGKYMNVTLVPFGKASFEKNETTGSYNFTCQHGPQECYGNKVQACALKDYTEESMKMKFIMCTMANASKDTEYPGQKCALEMKASYDGIENCLNTTGDSILAEYGEKTKRLQPPLSSVPLVVFEGKPDSKDQSLAVKNFKEALCSHISGQKPEECSTPNAASTNSKFILPSLLGLIASRMLYYL